MNRPSTSSLRSAITALALALSLGPVASRADVKPGDTPGEPVPLLTAPYLLVPQSRAFSASPSAGDPVRITDVAVDVSVEEHRATTTLVVTTVNATGADVQAQLLVPIPRRAELRRIGVEGAEGAESDLPATVARSRAAKALWTAASGRVHSFEPLEFASYDVARSAELVLSSHRPVRVSIVFESELRAEGDRLDYLLPRSCGAGPSAATWTIAAHVRQSRPIAAVFSPSDRVTSERTNSTGADVAAEPARQASGAFWLSILLGDTRPTATFYTYPNADSEGGAFLMVGGMPERLAERTRQRREVLVVLDRSGSMGGAKMEQAQSAIVRAIRKLDDGEAFNIIDYASEAAAFAPAPVLKDAQSVARVTDYVSSLRAVGGTNLNDALVRALRMPPTEGLRPLVLFVTDGRPTEGETRDAVIRANVQNANAYGRHVYTVGLGDDVNAPLLSAIAGSTGGLSTFVAPDADVEVKLGEAFARLGTAALSNAHVESTAEGLVSDLQPATLGDLNDGDQFVVAGRYAGNGSIPLRLTGDAGAGPVAYDFVLDPSGASRETAFVARLWASRKIADLAERVVTAAAPADGVVGPSTQIDTHATAADIVKLALDFGAVTEYTGFLAESDTDFSDAEDLETAVYRTLVSQTAAARAGSGSVARVLAFRAAHAPAPAARAATPATVLFVRDATFVRRGDTWVDLGLLRRENKVKADETVLPATPRAVEVRAAVEKERRSGLFAIPGAILRLGDKVIQLGGTGPAKK